MNILSLGAGVQSSTVFLMSCDGVLEKLDAAIFADTQWEPAGVYEYLDFLRFKAKLAGIPLYTVTSGNIREESISAKVGIWGESDGTKRLIASLPYYTSGGGQLRRQCTSTYKAKPVQQKIRQLLGLEKGERVKRGTRLNLWFGISQDEIRRVRISRVKWIEHCYPLLFGLPHAFRRSDCFNWIEAQGYPEPAKSACIGCPFHSAAGWRRIKDSPSEWQDVVTFDNAIRSNDRLNEELFLHPSRRPLEHVIFDNQEEMFGTNGCDEGYCGV